MKLPAQVSSFSESSPSVLSLQLKGDSGCLRASTGVLPGAGDGQELWRAPAEDACVYPHASVGSRRGEHLRTDSLGFLSCQPRVRLLPMATDLVCVTARAAPPWLCGHVQHAAPVRAAARALPPCPALFTCSIKAVHSHGISSASEGCAEGAWCNLSLVI